MTTAIQVNDLHYTYEGQDGGETHIVFDGLSLSIEQGSFVAVLAVSYTHLTLPTKA